MSGTGDAPNTLLPLKLKRSFMLKFYSEPVAALDLRLTRAEASLATAANPWPPSPPMPALSPAFNFTFTPDAKMDKWIDSIATQTPLPNASEIPKSTAWPQLDQPQSSDATVSSSTDRYQFIPASSLAPARLGWNRPDPARHRTGAQQEPRRGRPRKHRARTPLPPLYIFLRNLLHNLYYNPAVVTWVDQSSGCFRVTDTGLLAQTWGDMKQNRSEQMTYEKMARALRYHYGCPRLGRRGHLAMVRQKRLFYRSNFSDIL